MNADAPTLDAVLAALAGVGLTPRGAFHPAPGDGVPALADGRPARTLVLAGNAGPGLWRRFAAERDPARDSLDAWTRAVLEPVARRLGAAALYPFTAPPLPFQRWARNAEPCHASPLGLLIHPEWGLWHGYRGALAFADTLALPPRPAPEPSPCDSCETRPCLDACPVAAFSPDGFDWPACTRHLVRPEGADCMDLGCRARRACPVGAEHRHAPAQAAFHMRAALAGATAAAAASPDPDRAGPET